MKKNKSTKIKVGDVVRSLKKMCVHSIKDDEIICDWFDCENQLHRVKFKRDEVSIIS